MVVQNPKKYKKNTKMLDYNSKWALVFSLMILMQNINPKGGNDTDKKEKNKKNDKKENEKKNAEKK